jgi:hypothetical protein
MNEKDAKKAAAADFLGIRVLTPLEEEAVNGGSPATDHTHDHDGDQHHDHDHVTTMIQ